MKSILGVEMQITGDFIADMKCTRDGRAFWGHCSCYGRDSVGAVEGC